MRVWRLRIAFARWRVVRVHAKVGAGFVAGILLSGTTLTPALAQDRPDLRQAARALNEGRYHEVEALLGPGGEDDPERATIRARAAAAVGHDADAVAFLQSAAGAHPKSDASLELALLLMRLGRRREATPLLVPLVSLPDNPTVAEWVRAARAARALGDYERANDDLRQAAGQAPDDLSVNVAWGELFLEKYNSEEARRCFEAAASSDPRSIDAHLGLARAAAAADDVAAALASVRRALDINPSSVDALVLLADLFIRSGYEGPAAVALQKALAVNPRAAEAHALVAALARLDDRTADFDAAIARALAVNPSSGDAYRLVARQLAGRYRFDEALDLARKAVTLDPDNTRARADLGMDLLRTGDEDQAREELKRVFDADPYDVIAYNLLAVLDALKGFQTIRDGDIVLRTGPKDAAVLTVPVLALAHEALRVLSAKYQFSPKGPILIEIFPHHDDFAVRNLGIPGLVGALGACFGRVVTMDSPRAQPPGTFEWGATLWHELTHVITLQMSAQRVPRWLTEGISVFEEQQRQPEWRRPMDEAFGRALARRALPGLSDIHASFADSRTISLAYYHAGLVVRYLIETYGQEKFNGLVRSFADGATADVAFSRALGVTLAQVQAGFAQATEKWFGATKRALDLDSPDSLDGASLEQLKSLAALHPNSYDVQLALGTALRKQGEDEAARQALTRAAQLFPAAVGPDSPHAALAEMALEHGGQAEALAEMEKQLAQEPTNIELARRMAGMLGEDTDRDAAAQAPGRAGGDARDALMRRVYERIVALDPFDADAHVRVGRLAARHGDGQAAVREFTSALAAGASDPAGTRCDLADALLLIGDTAQAKRQTLLALEQSPTLERAQDLLLKLSEGRR